MTIEASATIAIVGGGQAGLQAAASLRELGFAGTIRLYCGEPWLPYQRPPLSKTYLKEASPPEKVYLRPDRYFSEQRIEVCTGTRVTAIDRTRRTLTLASGETANWDRLVLATGVLNRRLPAPGADLDGVVMLRGLDDAHAIRPRLAKAEQIVIVGGGVIGLEVAALSRGLGLEVDVIELGDRLCGRIASTPLSEHFLRYHRGLGTRVHLSAGVTQIEGRDGKVTAALLSTGERIATPLVLVCIGVMPDTALAEAAGLEVRDGILVDEHARTSDPLILAAGDCTRFRPAHGVLDSLRLESVQNAIDQAKCAAETIVGKPRPYDALPWFWSDQGALKLQIAGLTAEHDHTVVKADPAKDAMTVYCFAHGELIGVECVNRPADFMAARRVLGARRRVTIGDVETPGFELKQFMG
jgi:3-phenylpropionate/trans-cinnamate dioxygenase ferredoxin reductase subunit